MRPASCLRFVLFSALVVLFSCHSLDGVESPPPQPEPVSQTEPDLQTPPAPASTPPETTAIEPTPERYLIAGYHPAWLGDAWQSYPLADLDDVLFFDLSVAEDGTFAETNGWPDAWTSLLDAAAKHGTRIKPTISLFDTPAFVTLFETPGYRATLFAGLVDLIAHPQVHGLHLDFEIFDPVPSSTRAQLTAFVRDVQEAGRALDDDFALSMFTLAFDWNDSFDEAALAQHVDYFVVQGYDFHWLDGPTAGPVAPLMGWTQNWQTVLDRYDALGVPPAQIVMAVPYYGYEWPTEGPEPGSATRGPATIIPYAPVDGFERSARESAEQHGQLRDVASGSPYYVRRVDSGWYQGWFEDAVSLEAKYAFVRDQGLAGVALFPLGYGDATLHRVLRTALAASDRELP